MIGNQENIISSVSVDKSEVLRYLGHSGQEIDNDLNSKINQCIKETKNEIDTKYVYQIYDIKKDLNLRYMFNIININIPIYLRKVESKKKELEKSKRKLIKKLKSRKILARDVFAICRQLKKIDIEEFYSDVHIGNTNISITNFIYLFVNLIYGNLINIIDPNKFYMNIKPNFIENKLYIDFKIHVKPSIKNIIDILKAILIANKNSKKIKKEDKKYESNRINTKHHGNNA